ncbi:hypothetical protein [Klebsiella quasipneumoniae]|uniref:hypothetical protein n=1 Tax=Klebsiella quasipneumoniae TaxID=1463165 RepID=UPI0021819AC4|nr:hypothetical protein [Klebsiella quasipneumoniae]GKP80637.1 hypothetical protein NUKP48_25800 [Klebsiella quasipneumoniae]
MTKLIYLQGYPESLLAQVTTLIEQDRLGEVLQKRYPHGHDVNSDKALYQYTQDLKNRFLRAAAPINKVMYDSKIHVLNNAQLCCHMEPQYHQLEFDTRLWLTHLSLNRSA